MRFQTALLALVAAASAAPVADYKETSPYAGKPDLGAELGEAALSVLKWKISLLKAGAKIILTPAELAYEAVNEPDVYDTYQKKAYSRDADYSKPAYGGEVENPFEVLGDAALDVLKFKLFLLKSGAKIILSPFELAYSKLHDVQPSSYKPAGYDEKSTYARDYAPAPEEPSYKPSYGEENPFEELGEAALSLLRFKLFLIKSGAKIILSPFEIAYSKLHDVQPAYSDEGKKYYGRDAPAYPAPKYEAPKYESPAPKYQPETPDLLATFSEAALDILKFKLYLLSIGAKIVLSPLEAAYNDAHHPSPAVPYAGKTYY